MFKAIRANHSHYTKHTRVNTRYVNDILCRQAHVLYQVHGSPYQYNIYSVEQLICRLHK